jgi:Ni/Fe-hydrogenase subunit HybB-like protein/cytochrome c553
MSSLPQAAPVAEKKFLTPGTLTLVAFMAVGFAFIAVRFLFGIGKVSNLNNQYPWGIWIGIDVASGVALAAGGFTTGALAYVFNRHQYHAIIRPALLTAMLGYTFVVLGLMVDIGRYWNITSPMFNWNGNSVLFEVAICVMIYLNVLYIEFLPIVIERFKGRINLPGVLSGLNGLAERVLTLADTLLSKVMFVFIIAGIVLSCLHQSSLGSLMLIAPYKVHPLWHTPILPLLFLLSAFAVGYPMIVFESLLVSRVLGRRPEMEVLTPLSKFMPYLMGLYLVFKIGDMIVRRSYVYLWAGNTQSNAFIVEVLLGGLFPFVLVLFRKVRSSAGWLFFASTIFVVGILINRINVFLVSYVPPYKQAAYFPALGEIFITVGLIACLMFLYRVFIFLFPVLGRRTHQGVSTLLLITLLSGLLVSPGRVWALEGNGNDPKKDRVRPTAADAPSRVHSLNSQVIRKYSDLYDPVPFKHTKHLAVIKDCTVCHHRQPREKGDTYGAPLTLADLKRRQKLPVNCSSCHGKPFNPKQLHVPGLMGAYHQLCMDCHRKAEEARQTRRPGSNFPELGSAVAPDQKKRALTDCLACHAKKGTGLTNFSEKNIQQNKRRYK